MKNVRSITGTMAATQWLRAAGLIILMALMPGSNALAVPGASSSGSGGSTIDFQRVCDCYIGVEVSYALTSAFSLGYTDSTCTQPIITTLANGDPMTAAQCAAMEDTGVVNLYTPYGVWVLVFNEGQPSPSCDLLTFGGGSMTYSACHLGAVAGAPGE